MHSTAQHAANTPTNRSSLMLLQHSASSGFLGNAGGATGALLYAPHPSMAQVPLGSQPGMPTLNESWLLWSCTNTPFKKQGHSQQGHGCAAIHGMSQGLGHAAAQ